MKAKALVVCVQDPTAEHVERLSPKDVTVITVIREGELRPEYMVRFYCPMHEAIQLVPINPRQEYIANLLEATGCATQELIVRDEAKPDVPVLTEADVNAYITGADINTIPADWL